MTMDQEMTIGCRAESKSRPSANICSTCSTAGGLVSGSASITRGIAARYGDARKRTELARRRGSGARSDRTWLKRFLQSAENLAKPQTVSLIGTTSATPTERDHPSEVPSFSSAACPPSIRSDQPTTSQKEPRLRVNHTASFIHAIWCRPRERRPRFRDCAARLDGAAS